MPKIRPLERGMRKHYVRSAKKDTGNWKTFGVSFVISSMLITGIIMFCSSDYIKPEIQHVSKTFSVLEKQKK